MSQQQKVMIVFGVVAVAFIGLAASQSFDMNACNSNIQKAIDQYRKSMTASMQKFTNSLTSSGMNAVNADQINKPMGDLMNAMSSMADMSQGFDFQKMMANVNKITGAYMDMGRALMNTQAPMAMWRSYAGMLGEMMQANTEMMTNIPQNCVPQYKKVEVPQQ